ncbi:ran-binding protein 3 [Galendromus occidentalis]|uniref:Ran-binding protein 3 n=1 Tax=Galendromus occidentalis TaxID=34638 RepID=A0AAJ7PAJ2_9ACAR|nr:ran-binding protein 3 [Galendromus occidentalis]
MADNGTIGRNPFAIKTSNTPTRGSEDQAREPRPLVAPPTLVLGQEAPRSSGFVLKPSALSAQASNLKIYNTPTTLNNGKAETKESDRLSGDPAEKKDEVDEAGVSEKEDAPEKSIESDVRKGPDAENPLDGESEKEIEPGKQVEANRAPETGPGAVNTESQEEPKVPVEAETLIEKEETKLLDKTSDNEKIDGSEAAKSDSGNHSTASNSFRPEFRGACYQCSREQFRIRTESPRQSNETADVESKTPSDFAEAASVNAEPDNKTESPAKGEKRSLNETAEEYQLRMESDAKKSKLEEVEVVTGEEDERNVVQINCKLYIFEGNQYLERGRGVLRLNDKQNPEDGSLQSRVVMRTQGILRVVLNTKVWAGMSVEYANDRSLRMTGHAPDGTSAVYLIQCSTREAEQLYNALEWRVQALRNAGQTGSSGREDKSSVQDDKGDNTDSNSNTIG